MIAADGESCTLTFDGYSTTEIVKLCDLRPRGWEEEEEKPGTKRKKTDARANAKYEPKFIRACIVNDLTMSFQYYLKDKDRTYGVASLSHIAH